MFDSLVIFLDDRLFVHEITHGLFALPLAIYIWRKTKDFKKVLLVFLVVYFVDLDHLVDYVSFWGFSFSMEKVVGNKYFSVPGTAYVPFHGWEWILALLFLGRKKKLNSYLFVIGLSLLNHLILDATHVHSVVFYSFFYRLVRGFPL